MFVTLLVLGAISIAVGGIGFVSEGYHVGFIIALSGGFLLFIIGAIETMKNYFFELAAPVKECLANIGVLQKQYDELIQKLEALVEKYFNHETGLLDALKGRNASKLCALLESYPELKAMGGTQTLITKIVELRGQICDAQKGYNKKAAEFNKYAQMSPYRNLIPAGLEKTFEYIDPSTA